MYSVQNICLDLGTVISEKDNGSNIVTSQATGLLHCCLWSIQNMGTHEYCCENDIIFMLSFLCIDCVHNVRFEVLTEVIMKSVVFWVVMPCSLVRA
jgi:hypothetical protein